MLYYYYLFQMLQQNKIYRKESQILFLRTILLEFRIS